jgi:hypothetical protein
MIYIIKNIVCAIARDEIAVKTVMQFYNDTVPNLKQLSSRKGAFLFFTVSAHSFKSSI